jgi:hypothetical protein
MLVSISFTTRAVRCGAPQWPDAVPTLRVYHATNLGSILATLSPWARKRSGEEGWFHATWDTGGATVPGVYIISATWSIGGTTYARLWRVTLRGEANSDGPILSAFSMPRPDGVRIVYHRAGGKLQASRGPY